jgi:hypothetical protein
MLAGSLLAALAPVAAQSQSNVDDRASQRHALVVSNIANGFRTLAGSVENARALVEALHQGVPVRLVAPDLEAGEALPCVTLVEPPTGPMSWNDVKMALMLTRDALMAAGITRPNHQQVHAALLGGVVSPRGRRPVNLRGVLTMRAEGMNWGRIAAARYLRPAIARVE